MPRAAIQSDGGGILISTSQQLDDYLRGSGAAVTPESALRAAAVYASVRLISGAVANMPVDVKKRIDERTREEASNHWLYGLIERKPNSWMKPAVFRRLMTTNILLRGNAYALIVWSGDRAVALQPLHPDRVTVKQLPSLDLEYTYRKQDGSSVMIPQRNMLHLMGLTLDGVTGVSVITYARETIGLSLATQRHGSEFFKNNTNVGSVIKSPMKIGLEGQELLRASLNAYRQGGENSHKTLILEQGADFAAIGMTAQDAQFVETVKASRTDIAMFFGVPPFMIGDTDKSTSWGTGIEQQSIGFVTYTLEDWLTCWEEGLNSDLLLYGPEYYARFNRNALTRGDIKTRWEAYVKALQWGVMSPNEVRTLEDQNPRDGGDVYYPPPNTAGNATQDNPTNDNAGNIAAAIRDMKPTAITVDARTNVEAPKTEVHLPDVKIEKLEIPPIEIPPVNVRIDAPKARRARTRTVVTEHDADGRIKAFEQEEIA